MNDLLRGIASLLVAIVGLRNSLWIGRVERQQKDRSDENEKRIDQLSRQVTANGRSVAELRDMVLDIKIGNAKKVKNVAPGVCFERSDTISATENEETK